MSHVEPIGVVTLGDEYLLDELTQKWVIIKPAYAKVKPWKMAGLSGMFLNANAVKITGHLNPGLCLNYNYRYKKLESLFKIKQMIAKYNNDSSSEYVYIVGKY